MISIKNYSVEYATVRCFSPSNKWGVLLADFQTFDLIDKDFNIVRHLNILASQEPRWDYGHLLWINGNSISFYDPELDYSHPNIYKFNEYIFTDATGRNGVQGMGEGDIENGKIALAGMKSDGSRDIFLFNLRNLTKGRVLTLQQDESQEATFNKSGRAHGFDNIYATPDGNVLVSWYSSGNERFQGVELFDGDMNFIKQLTHNNAHMDIGPKGLVWCSSNDSEINLNSVYLVEEKKDLFSPNWDYAFHISCCDKDFCIVSLNAPSEKQPYQLWKVFYNGDHALLDSYDGPYKGYESQQKASVSLDGTKIARCRFDGKDYFTDIFDLSKESKNEIKSDIKFPGFHLVDKKAFGNKSYLFHLLNDGTFNEYESD